MNFFDQQEQALKKSRSLIFIYFVCICLIIAVIYFTVFFLFSVGAQYQEFEHGGLQLPATLWNPALLFVVVMSTLSVIGIGTIIKVYALSGGGGAVAESLGGVLVATNTKDPLERRLLNVVEEMAIASGVPVPRVYILPSENGINAFAAGTRIDTAVIGVTRGCLRLLRRDELQGVIAHEFSHILNGDMRLNLRLIGVLSGLLILSQIGYWAFRLSAHRRGGRSRNGDAKAQVAILIVGLVVMVMGYLGVLCSRIIKSAVSRQREFLADASAVQFTRNPDGIGGALKKIGGLQAGSRIESPNAEEASHMFFSSGFSFSSLFATHPPLRTRIKKIDPAFNGTFDTVREEELVRQEEEVAEKEIESNRKGGFAIPGMEAVRDSIGGVALLSAQDSAALAPNSSGADTVLDSIGTTDASHIAYAQVLREAIPQELLDASHDPCDARGLICALLIVSSGLSRDEMFAEISEVLEPDIRASVESLLPILDSLGVVFRIPLVEMSIPVLRSLSDHQSASFLEVVYKIITADKKISLFEYVLSKIITNRLQGAASEGIFSKEKSLDDLTRECSRLLAIVARYGTSNPQSQERAFSDGLKEIFPASAGSLASIPAIPFRDLDRILESLLKTGMKDRQKVIHACFHTIRSDGQITVEQAEVFRAIADTLEVPVPPILANTNG
jgi:Zn-dependent protease with chaperone function